MLLAGTAVRGLVWGVLYHMQDYTFYRDVESEGIFSRMLFPALGRHAGRSAFAKWLRVRAEAML